MLRTENINVFINLPSGKLSKKGERKPINQQVGMTCILYGLRRIAFFDQTNSDTLRLNAYKRIKHAMKNFNENYDYLVQMAFELCNDLKIDIAKCLETNLFFMQQYNKSEVLTIIEDFNLYSAKMKWSYLYFILVENIISPLMSINNSNWHPRDGFTALAESLKSHGAHAFLGKFGSCFHWKNAKPSESESTSSRPVSFFEKNTFCGNSIPYTHCIIVDQVKIVNGKEMIFFRDPNYNSSIDKPEQIFMLSYENFVQRLTNFQGRSYVHYKDLNLTFGRVSTRQANLQSK